MKKASKLSTFIALLLSLAMTIGAIRMIVNISGSFRVEDSDDLNFIWNNILFGRAKNILVVIGLLGLIISLVLINILIKKFRSQ